MKKIFVLIILLSCFVIGKSQSYGVLHIENINWNEEFQFCESNIDGVIIYGKASCTEQQFFVINDTLEIVCDSVIITSEYGNYVGVQYVGCGNFWFAIRFIISNIHSPFPDSIVWKRKDESITIGNEPNEWSWLWSTGETTSSIEVTEPGTYFVTISDLCGSETYSIEVRDNVEIDLATCDLESNLNMVTWPTTVAQAEYVDHLNVKRDGITVATANYSDGFFLDNIGSDAAPRTYSLVAVGTDGTECPIESYPKETIHMSYLLGVGNTVEVGWNQPSGYDLLGYNICEWNPNDKDGDLTVIDFVGAGVTSYTCQASQFDNGNIVVQGVEAGKTENRLLSNRSWEILNVGEQPVQNFKIYPNPSNGTFIVEGVSTLTIYSMLSQIIATSQSENGVHTFTLAPGIYFVKSGEGMVKKVVVE